MPGCLNMGKTINDLIGAKVQDFLMVHDYVQVITDLAEINIFNPFKCLIKNEDISVDIQGKELINSAITRMEYQEDIYLRILYDDKKILEISLSAEDYCGLEAFDIHFNTGEVIVKN